MRSSPMHPAARLQTLLGDASAVDVASRSASDLNVTPETMRESVIVSAVRTPTGKFLGALKELHRAAARRARRRRGRPPRRHRSRRSSTSASWATSCRAGLGQNPARQAALHGGLPDHVAALTINKVCGSGLKAVMLADQGIRAGDIDIAVAGGMESMSNCPYLLPRVREGLRMGNGEVVDSMINDGLWCAFEQCHMGNAGEVVAEHYHVGRAAQDEYAARSHQKAARATDAGRVHGRDPAGLDSAEEGRRRSSSIATRRSAPTRRSRSLAALKPAFKKDGTVTAGNAPGVNDGASALVVMAADARAVARPHAARAHRRPGDERPRAEVRADDAGRSRAPRRARRSAGSSTTSISSS